MRSGPRTLTWMRRLAYAVASVLVLWGLVWVAAPPLMRAQSQKRLSAALGRPVTIEAVDFKPWSMELTVRGLAIGPAPGAAPAPRRCCRWRGCTRTATGARRCASRP